MGATFATVLGVLAMIPLTLLILLPVFKPSASTGQPGRFHYADPKTAGSRSSWPGSRDLLERVAMEPRPVTWANAVTRSGTRRSRSPRRPVRLFIYIGTAVVFIGVLGAALKSFDPLTLYTASPTTSSAAPAG